MANYRFIENLELPEVLPESGFLLALMDDEFFYVEQTLSSTSGVSSGTSTTSATPGSIVNTSAAASGTSTTSAQAQGLSVATWTKHPNVSIAFNVYGYWQFTPASANANTPCIIFWHGMGDQGDGGDTQLDYVIRNSLPKLINDRMGTGSEFPHHCIVICPQYIGTPLSGLAFQNVINWVKANKTFDQTKLHLAGYSLGAGCICNWWEVGTIEDVASCVVMATPLGYSSTAAPRLVSAGMPILFPHGDQDVSPTQYSKSVGWVDGLTTDGLSPTPILDTLPGEGHNIDQTVHDWTWYYPVTANQDTIEWQLQFSRIPLTNTTGTAAGTSTTSASPKVTANAQATSDGTSSVVATPRAVANTSASAAGSSTASIEIGNTILDTSAASAGTSTATAAGIAIINTTAVADGISSSSAAARSIASTTGVAFGASTASIEIGITTINTSGVSSGTSATSSSVIGRANVLAAASGDTTIQALALAISNTAAVSGGTSVAFALSQFATILNTSGLADGVSSTSVSAFGLLIRPQIINTSSRIRTVKSGNSTIYSTINAVSKI